MSIDKSTVATSELVVTKPNYRSLKNCTEIDLIGYTDTELVSLAKTYLYRTNESTGAAAFLHQFIKRKEKQDDDYNAKRDGSI